MELQSKKQGRYIVPPRNYTYNLVGKLARGYQSPRNTLPYDAAYNDRDCKVYVEPCCAPLLLFCYKDTQFLVHLLQSPPKFTPLMEIVPRLVHQLDTPTAYLGNLSVIHSLTKYSDECIPRIDTFFLIAIHYFP